MTDEADESNIIAESMSPNGNIVAFVEATRKCVYLYLSGKPRAG